MSKNKRTTHKISQRSMIKLRLRDQKDKLLLVQLEFRVLRVNPFSTKLFIKTKDHTEVPKLPFYQKILILKQLPTYMAVKIQEGRTMKHQKAYSIVKT